LGLRANLRFRPGENGRGGLQRDEREAVNLFRLAAEQGHAGAQSYLGLCSYTGLSCLPKDDREAARFFKLSADLKSRAASRSSLGNPRSRQAAEEPPPPSQEVVLLTQIRDELAKP
jgi:TPR repeat protein